MRFTRLMLFQAQHDQATELTIGLARSGQSPIRYKVGGIWYDVSPPPEHIMPNVIAELGRMAGIDDRPYPKEGLIDIPFGGVRLRWVVRIASADADCVLTPVER